MVAASIDVAGENKERRAIRQTGARDSEFFQGAIVVTVASEQKIGHGKMGLGGIGAKAQRCFHCGLGEEDPLGRRIEIEKVEQIVCARRITVSRAEVLVAFDRLFQQLQRFEQCSSHVFGDEIAIDDLLRLKVKLKCNQILSGTFFDLSLLFGRKFCLELRDNRLRINTKSIPGALHGTFNDISNAELLTDLAQIALHATLVLTRTGVANDFQLRDLSKVGENLILHTIGEESIRFILAKILKRQDSDRFCPNFICAVLLCGCCETSEKEQADRQKRSDNRDVNPGAGFCARVNRGTDIFGSLDSFRRELKCPCDHERDWESNHDSKHDQSDGPIRDFEKWKNLRGGLDQQPANNRIRNRDLVNIAPLQLGEEVA